jgi:hypothetical protein
MSLMRAGTALAVRKPPPVQAPALRVAIGDIETQLAALADERPDCALDAINAFAGAEARLAEIDGKADALERRRGVLADALAAASAADARAAVQRDADARRAQVAAVKKHLRG